MNTSRTIIAVIFFASIGFLVFVLAAPKTWAADFQVCCACKPTPCPGSVSTVNGATDAAARVACDRWCGVVRGTISCVQNVTEGACQTEVGVRGGPVIGFTNPICKPGEPCTPQIIIGNIIRAALGIVGSLALLMFVYGGFIWMVGAQKGAEKKVRFAKDIIKWATLGLFVIFGSYLIVNFIINSFTA